MDFFEAQAHAKRRTTRLVALFALAVLGTIVLSYLAAMLFVNWARLRQGYGLPELSWFDPGVLTACVANLLNQRRRLRERFRQGESPPPSTAPAAPSGLDLRLRPLVEAHLVDPSFGPEALAEAASLSYHQLYRALRDELGTTPTRYIRTVRAECAAALLRQGAGSVTEIAYAVGFESLSYFRRAFKERFEATPSDFLASKATP